MVIKRKKLDIYIQLFIYFTKFIEHGHGHDHSHGKLSTPVNDNTTAIDEILVHPAASRQSIVDAAQETILEEEGAELEEEEIVAEQQQRSNEEIPQPSAIDANKHDHHSHKSQSLNMRGVFIHVLGDALGNVGVIASGIFIYLTDYSWKYYADPIVRYYFFTKILIEFFHNYL